jgi:nitric-oxide synthase
VEAEVAATGTYTHTSTELTYGAKLAWRNSSRCIGRLYWHSLVVRDSRHVGAADEIFTELVEHLRVAGDRTRRAIRPVISIFGPAAPGRPFARVWNEQLVRYAGYVRDDGTVVGDPRYVDFTAAMVERGWQGKGEAFDVLPVVIQTPSDGVRVFELPDAAVWEVPLAHPELAWFADLGLRWHAVPAISNMRLSIGGVDYPLAPFNGWYLGTEIGARNLADADRFNMVPRVAKAMGLDTSTERSLWRDRALVELNRAVLWSFDQAGARISDHHTESSTSSATAAGRSGPAGRCRPTGRGSSADVRRRDACLPPLLRGVRPAAELLPRRRRGHPGPHRPTRDDPARAPPGAPPAATGPGAEAGPAAGAALPSGTAQPPAGGSVPEPRPGADAAAAAAAGLPAHHRLTLIPANPTFGVFTGIRPRTPTGVMRGDPPGHTVFVMTMSPALLAGRYRLLEPLGNGGMGRVWLAATRCCTATSPSKR